MDIQGMAGSNSQIYDKQTFGAAVVTKTLDYMNNSASSAIQPFDKQTFGAYVVTKTLDYMHSGPSQHQNQNSYSFQKDVLGSHYSGVGTFVNLLA